MEMADMITIGVVVIGFFGQTMYFKGVFSERITKNDENIQRLEHDIEDVKSTVRWADTCSAIHDGLNTRVKALERLRNGKN